MATWTTTGTEAPLNLNPKTPKQFDPETLKRTPQKVRARHGGDAGVGRECTPETFTILNPEFIKPKTQFNLTPPSKTGTSPTRWRSLSGRGVSQPGHRASEMSSTGRSPVSPHPKPQPLNPKPHTPNPKPKTQNPNPKTPNPNSKPQTPSPKPSTPNPKPLNPNPQPQNQILKPETGNSTGVFVGSVPTEMATPICDDSVIQVLLHPNYCTNCCQSTKITAQDYCTNTLLLRMTVGSS